MTYEWIKIVHLLAVFAWMAGLFYLPRLYVYHADATVGSELDATFVIMERRLLKAIMRPAAVATLLTGLLFIWFGIVSVGDGWLLGKLAGVVGLFGFHGLLETYAVRFRRGNRAFSARYFRLINEVPTVLLVWIVFWVVVKPFA